MEGKNLYAYYGKAKLLCLPLTYEQQTKEKKNNKHKFLHKI